MSILVKKIVFFFICKNQVPNRVPRIFVLRFRKWIRKIEIKTKYEFLEELINKVIFQIPQPPIIELLKKNHNFFSHISKFSTITLIVILRFKLSEFS